MHVFCQCLGKTICKGLEKNAAVVVVICFEPFDVLINADAGCYSKTTNEILGLAFDWRDEIRKSIVRLSTLFCALLAQIAKED